MITPKDRHKDAAGKTLLIILLIFVCSTFAVFGQEKTPQSSLGTLLKPEQEETPKPTPEAKKPTRERKVEESNKSSIPQNTPNYSPEDYPAPPTVDYMKEAERFQREMKSGSQKQTNDAQRQMEQMQREAQAERERQQAIQNQVIQQQNDRLNSINEPLRENALESQKQDEAAKKIAAGQWKWIWLIPLFEILQVVGLGLIAFKYKVAKKSTVFMIAGLMAGLFVFLFITALNKGTLQNIGIQSSGWRLVGAAIGIIGIYAFAVGKLSTYIIVSLTPQSLPTKLLSVFGVGCSLIALYLFINAMTGYGSIGALFGLGVMFIGGILALVKGRKGSKEDLHGSARFADRQDFKEFENSVETGAFILAPAHPDGKHGKIALPRSLSVMHGLIFGGSGTGKTRGYFMANCAEVENTSLVVTDPKSELWKFTSGYHNKALKFAPTEPEASQCFNWIPLCNDARMSELCARALMTAGSTSNTDQFWIDSETAFLSAIFAHTATTKYPTPLTAYRLFTRQKPEELMQQLLHSPSYVAREQAIVFEQTDARIKGAIVPAIASRLQFMRDPSLQLFTSASLEAPNFGQLRRTPTAVYWCLREQDIARLRPLTSLFFTVLLEQIAGEEVPEGETSVPITAMLDEFANIGKIPDFETTISLARGRGVALWLGIQSLSQIKQTYGEHAAQTIMSNCATKVALHGLDYQTAEYVSKSLGEQTISHSSSSFNIGLSGGSIGSHAAKHRRPLLTPDEVMRIGENEAIARTSNKYPMRLYKGYYDAPPKTYPVTPSLAKVYVEETEVAEDLAL
jgi:type IV secretion system protein VirD4